MFREKTDHHNLQKQTPMKYPCLPERLVSTLGWSLFEIRITKPHKWLQLTRSHILSFANDTHAWAPAGTKQTEKQILF